MRAFGLETVKQLPVTEHDHDDDEHDHDDEHEHDDHGDFGCFTAPKLVELTSGNFTEEDRMLILAHVLAMSLDGKVRQSRGRGEISAAQHACSHLTPNPYAECASR